MTKLTAVESVTLDGVMQAPGSLDEDPRGGFAEGGWAGRYTDEVGMRVAREGLANAGNARCCSGA